MENAFVVFLIIAVVAIAIMIYGISKKCPECGKWFAEETIGEELLGSQSGWKTVTRQDHHKDAKGNLIKTVERKEQVQVVRSQYNVSHRCKNCEHEWITKKNTETES